MAGFFDDTENTTSPVETNFFADTEADEVPERTIGSTLKDVGISLAKGTLAAGQGLVGLADIPTGGKVGKAFDAIGITPEEWQKDLSEEYSPAQQAAQAKVESAKGFVDTAKAMIENPSTIGHGIVETIPSMLAGGVIGKGALAIGTRFAPQAVSALGKGAAIGAAALGEGTISAGQTAEEIRNQTVDKELTAKQSGLALASGVGTGIFGVVGGSLAKKLGFADVDTMIVSGLNPAKKEGIKGVAKSIIGGGITEGVFEELPQTVQETIFTNAALDKPLLEGVPEGAAQAIILGGVMGGGANLLPGKNVAPEKTPYELELERRAGNILGLEKPKFDESIKRLNDELATNQELLNDPVKFDAKIREQNIAPEELVRQIIVSNKDNQALLDKINSGLKAKDEQTKAQAKKEYDALSPEEKAVKDAANKLSIKRQESALALNEQINTIDEQLSGIKKEYERLNLDGTQKPEDKQKLANDYINLNQEKNKLLDRYKQEVVQSDLAPYTTREERQKIYENLFGTYSRTVPSNKDAKESANIFQSNTAKLDEIQTRIDQERDLNKKTDLQNLYNQVFQTFEKDAKESADVYTKELGNVDLVKQTMDQMLQESDPIVRQKIYNQMFILPGVKDAQESAQIFEDNAPELEQQLENRRQAEGEKFYTDLFAQEKRPFSIDAFEEVTSKSAADSAAAFEQAGMGRGQASPFTDERQVPLTDNQQIIVDKNNFEITKLTEQLNRTIDRDTRINLLNQIDALEKDNATIRTSVEQFPQFQTTEDDSLNNIIPGATYQGFDGMIHQFKDSKNRNFSSLTTDPQEVKERYAKMLETWGEEVPKLQTSEKQNFIQQVSLADIERAFPGQTVTRGEDGTISVQFKNGKGLTINSIQSAGQDLIELAIATGQMSKNGKILGITVGNKIMLDSNFADNKTLWHENKHVLDNLGLITNDDNNALNKEFNKLRKAGKLEFALSNHKDPRQAMVENRANMFAQIMTNREAYRNTTFGKVIQRVMDFFSQLFSFGKQTVSGLAREVESGKVYERQVAGQNIKTTIPMAEQVANQWHSALENAVNGFQQKIGTPDQWKGMIKGYPGIKQEELDWIGLDEWLDSQTGKVTKDELVKFIAENNVKLEEVVKEDVQDSLEKLNARLAPYGYSYQEEYDDWSLVSNDSDEPVELNDAPEAVRRIMMETGDNYNEANDAKYSQYQLPGGKNYKEMLITIPNSDPASFEQYMEEKHGKYWRSLADDVISDEFFKRNEARDKTVYKSSHWEEPNILTHIRFNERTDADGNKVLFIEEVQSDWHQAGRKEGYGNNPKVYWIVYNMSNRNETKTFGSEKDFNKFLNENPNWDGYEQEQEKDLIPDAPFKKSWSLLAMKRMVRYAAENGFDKIAWTTGQQQFDRYPGGTDEEQAKRKEGMIGFYDQMLPSMLNKEFNRGKWGNAKVEQTAVVQTDLIGGYGPAPVNVLSIPITNRMKSKALREGMPMFEVRETPIQKISDDTYNQMFAERNGLVRTIGQTLRMRGGEIKQLFDKGFGAISTRLKNVDPMLRAEIRNLDFRTAQKIVTALRVAHPLLEKTKQMSAEDKFVWDAARRNSDEVKIQQIASKYNMVEDQNKLRSVLNQIRQDAIDVGYDVGFIEEYWPRIIKDQEGFLQATKGISQRPVITDAIKRYADKLGMTVERFEAEYPEQAADIASNTILGRNLGIGGPGNIQARQYETVPPELNKFYMDSDAALMQYIYSMTKKIEARRFFGKVPDRIAALKAEKKRKTLMLKEITNAERREELSNDLLMIEQQLDKYKLQRDYTENIGTYINDLCLSGRIQAEDEKTVRDILDARFHEHGTTGPINAYKNMAYIDVMGSPISALTQIGDLAWAMYVGKVWTPRGLASTVKNVGKAIAKKSEITKEDLGIERIAQEFADGTTLSNAVSWVFKKVGLEKIDSIGKETLINNAFDNYKAMASTEVGRANLLKQIKPIFGTESDGVINDLLAGNPTDNIKMLLYHRLLDFQPVALSEMPEQYLKSGNGRVFYMLKTYTLKQFDVFRNEAWHNIKNGYLENNNSQVIEGISNMVKLASLLTLANAGADELKDWLLGKDTKFEDHVVENFLTMGGASKHLRMQTTREGLGSGLIGQILPPFKFVNSISRDLYQGYGDLIAGDTINFDHARIVESIPLGGKIYYWHYGRGEDYKKSSNEQEFSNVGKDVKLFKRQFENAQDKRTFLNSNLDKFKQMKLHENFQASLNRNQAVINKLKEIPQTTNVRERLGQLQAQRELILKKYFEVAQTVQ